MELTHLDADGNLQMVNVGSKKVVRRYARASAFIELQQNTMQQIQLKQIAKGNVLAAARVAAISAAKKTAELIPLTHNINLDAVNLSFSFQQEGIAIESEVWCEAKTGVEMEALTACAVAALTIYDMCKAIDKKMCIREVKLLEKKKDEI